MDAVLNLEDITLSTYFANAVQTIVPGNTFTCNGSILSWTVGAEWSGDKSDPVFTELQVWRKSGEGLYTKVGSNIIMAETENSSSIYHFPLASPLAFQAGDILGYFQGSPVTRQLGLLHEILSFSFPIHFNAQESSASQLNINQLTILDAQVFISPNTGKQYKYS